MVESYEKPSGNCKAFLADLSALLEKYMVEITAADEWMGYAECGSDIQIRIESQYGSESNYSVPMGEYVDKEKIDRLIAEAKEGE